MGTRRRRHLTRPQRRGRWRPATDWFFTQSVELVADYGVTTAADKGKVRKVPATSGTYRLIGIAEEAFVDGQLVRVRPTFGSVTV